MGGGEGGGGGGAHARVWVCLDVFRCVYARAPARASPDFERDLTPSSPIITHYTTDTHSLST